MAQRFEIEIPRWDEFQVSPSKRRADGRMEWIKIYTRLLDDPRYLELTDVQRATLHGLWLWRGKGPTWGPLSLKMVNTKLGLTIKMVTLEALNQAGFIELRLPVGYSQGALEEKRVDKEVRVEAPLGFEVRGAPESDIPF